MLNIALLLGLGAFGGLLNHLYFHNNLLLLPSLESEENGKILNLGFLSEVFLGIGGALAAVLLAEKADVLRQAALALLGGFGGGGLLAQNAANLERQRALAFKQISEALASAPIKPHKLENHPEQLTKLLKQLGHANSRRGINRLRREALLLLKDWFADK